MGIRRRYFQQRERHQRAGSVGEFGQRAIGGVADVQHQRKRQRGCAGSGARRPLPNHGVRDRARRRAGPVAERRGFDGFMGGPDQQHARLHPGDGRRGQRSVRDLWRRIGELAGHPAERVAGHDGIPHLVEQGNDGQHRGPDAEIRPVHAEQPLGHGSDRWLFDLPQRRCGRRLLEAGHDDHESRLRGVRRGQRHPHHCRQNHGRHGSALHGSAQCQLPEEIRFRHDHARQHRQHLYALYGHRGRHAEYLCGWRAGHGTGDGIPRAPAAVLRRGGLRGPGHLHAERQPRPHAVELGLSGGGGQQNLDLQRRRDRRGGQLQDCEEPGRRADPGREQHLRRRVLH